jgi:hypothetical protein
MLDLLVPTTDILDNVSAETIALNAQKIQDSTVGTLRKNFLYCLITDNQKMGRKKEDIRTRSSG